MSNTLNTASVELSARSVVVTGAGALSVAAATLIALAHGWDYSYAVLAGCAASVLLAWLCWIELPAERTGDRAAALLAGTLGAALFCVYALAKVDRGLLPTHGSLVGLTVGLVVFVLQPARYVLNRAQAMPNAAGLMLSALALAPVTLGLVEYELNNAMYVFIDCDDPTALPYCRATMLLAGLGFAFALRRRMRASAWAMLAVFASVCGALCLYGHFKAAALCAAGTAAGAFALIVLVRWYRTHAGPHALTAKTRLVLAAMAVGIAFLVCPELGPLLVAACAMWPLLSEPSEQRPSEQRVVAKTPKPSFLPPLGMTAALFGLAGALCTWLCAYAFLVPAAFAHWTAPELLAELRNGGVWTVSETTFTTAMMRDQYLWRDELASAPRPNRYASQPIYAWRHERDRWSGIAGLEEELREDAKEAVGYGFDVGSQPGQGSRVAYVFEDSPAHKAGMRRGDTIVAVQGVPTELFAQNPSWVSSVGPAHFKLVSPQGAEREIAITQASYPVPAVAAEKVLDVDGRKVGYIALRHFVGTVEWEFDVAAYRLQGQGIEELVLDLRMNRGGRVDAAQEIASTIGGRRLEQRTFLKLIHNSRYRDLDKVVRFHLDGWGSNGLSLSRVFIITSQNTCSASEALIQGLSPHMDVITVGGKTCGKPVGFSPVPYGNRVYYAITFRTVNARGEGDYYGGLAPTCPARDDLTHELGDPEEASLKAALHYMRFGRCPEPVSDSGISAGV